MPGRSSDSGLLQYVGVLAAVIGVIGFVVLGWEFDGDSGMLPMAIAGVFVAIAIGSTVYRRVG